MSRKAEIRAIEEAHRAAQARIGLSAAFLSLAAWRTVSAMRPRETGSTWLTSAIRSIYVTRMKSARLARAYYQLVRALETGRTLGRIDGATGPVTLAQLRKQFTDLLLDVATIDTERGSSNDPDEKWFEDELRALTGSADDENARSIRLADTKLDTYVQDLLDATDSDNRTISVDGFTWPTDQTLDQLDRLHAANLTREAIESQEKKLKAFAQRAARNAEKALQQMEAEHMRSGSAGAGYVDWAGINGGRDHLDYAITRDRLVMMIARGLGPNPCAFCAMLASRGFVYASSTATTTRRTTTVKGNAAYFEPGSGGIRKYHKNCHCYPIIAFSTRTELPPQNAYYKKLWEDNIEKSGLSANDALNEWRVLLHKQQSRTAEAAKTQARLTP